MNVLLNIISALAVGLFGAILSASFCDIKWSRKNILWFLGTLAVITVLQATAFVTVDLATVRKLYPFITHLPLVLLLGQLSRKRLWSLFAVMTAYLCCQLRRWVGLFSTEIFQGGTGMQDVVEILVTLPLLYLILRFASPAVRSMSHFPRVMQIQFGVIPMVNYLFDYMTRIYTDWLSQGMPAAVEFMPFVCSAAYLLFALHIINALQKKNELEQAQAVLNLQIKQSAREIDALRRTQEQAAAYRHDMRHHLQFLAACLEEGSLTQAQEYIQKMDHRLSHQVVTQYCPNRSVNLILSAFAGRAAEAGVDMEVRVQLEDSLRVSDNDLCVLLSNALENALNACISLQADGKETCIKVHGFEKGSQIILEIVNSCGNDIVFENGLPVTQTPGHGIGVRSICAVAEKYNGLYFFEVKEGRFFLRLVL